MSNSIKILVLMVVFQLSLPFVTYSQELFKAKLGIKIKPIMKQEEPKLSIE